jgi:catechol 2,3-dioxygenase-like lactoylglutathione lyase family enzyme
LHSHVGAYCRRCATVNETEVDMSSARAIDMKLEVIVLPVEDVDRAKDFYSGLGWRLDGDFVGSDELRVVQFTPPGSRASIIFGRRITTAAPGSAQGMQLVVPDIEAARGELVGRGVDVSEVFHDKGRVFHHAGTEGRISGPDPQRRSYGSFASFNDPDGNGWLLQEITQRLPGRVNAETTFFAGASDLASALRRTEAAHGAHEARTGQKDPDWPSWYAEYLVREQAGEELPS